MLPFLPNLTVGPVSLSLPELAQALTTAGMPCVASASLADRGAFVCLRDRAPGAVRRIVGEALGVTFRARGQGWEMAVNPEARERERLLLIGYRRQAEDRARAWSVEKDRIRVGRSYAALARWADEAAERLKAIPSGSEGLKQAEGELPTWLDAAALLQPPMWCVVRDARNPQATGPALERSYARPVVVASRPLALGLPEATLRSKDLPGLGPATSVTTSWSFNPYGGTYTARTMMALRDGAGVALFDPHPFRLQAAGLSLAMGTVGDVEVPAEGSTLKETFGRMGERGRDYLTSLDAPDPLPDAPEVDGDRPTLSHVLERLGEKGMEAVMELSPRFERAPISGRSEKTSLRRVLHPVPDPTPDYAKATPEWLRRIAYPDRGPGYVERRFPWRAVPREGAWIVMDPLAFLDRVQWVSPVPYLRAERILAKVPEDAAVPDWSSDQRLPDWGLLTELAGAVGDGLGENLTDGYRGVRLALLAPLFPVARRVAEVPPGERAALWREARTKAGATLATPRGAFVVRIKTIRTSRKGSVVAQVSVQRWEDGKVVENGEGYVDGRGMSEEGGAR